MLKLPDDVHERLAKNEWFYLQEKYPNVAFNIKPDRPMPDGRKMNTPEYGFKHLFQLEPGNVLPEQWDPSVLAQFDSVISWNSKFEEMYGHLFPIYHVGGCTFFNDYFKCVNHIPYEEKINGIVCINKLYSVPDNRAGHIVQERERVMCGLGIEPMVKHVFSPHPWGGDCYQGPTEVYQPGHSTLLTFTNKYKFRLCFESIYDEYWSWDFMTERIFDCFKAKTIPIYWGCYNIEEHVPTELFIDFRQFVDDLDDLADYLTNFPEDLYREMTDRAFEWVQNNRIGCVEDVEAVLRTLS
jgi:hypothetical protein